MGVIPHHCTKYGGGAKKSGGRFHDKFKLMKNTIFLFSHFNSGLLLLIKATCLTMNSYVQNYMSVGSLVQ